MAENQSAPTPPAAGFRKAAPGGAYTSLEAHREEPVSNGKCGVSEPPKKVQNEGECESPTWESACSDSARKPIPRRSSLIKVGRNNH